VGGKKVLLTFGLLSPNKGIEHVLNALPDVVAEFPDVVYILLGVTHPMNYEHEAKPIASASRLSSGKTNSRTTSSSTTLCGSEGTDRVIGAADLYVTPYLDEAQITSGTLAYAFAAGKAVISTPYWHAAELLRDQRGILVPFGDRGDCA